MAGPFCCFLPLHAYRTLHAHRTNVSVTCSKTAKAAEGQVGDKEKTASSKAREANKLEDEAAKLHERSQRAQERAETTQKEAEQLKSGLSGLQGAARAKRSSAERCTSHPALQVFDLSYGAD